MVTQIEIPEVGRQFGKYSFSSLFSDFFSEREILNHILKFCA